MLTDRDLEKISNLVDSKLELRLKPIHTALRKINKDIKAIINFFDREVIDLHKRLKIVESRMGITSPGFN